VIFLSTSEDAKEKPIGFTTVMKTIGINIIRVSKSKKRHRNPEEPQCGVGWTFLEIHEYVKEQIARQARAFSANKESSAKIFKLAV